MVVFRLRDGDGAPFAAPSWFVDWVRLGIVAAEWSRPGNATRLTVAIAGPTEEMAAAATAFGFVRAAYLDSLCTEALPLIDLSQLSMQQRIWFRAGSTIRTARFLGLGERGTIRTSNGQFLSARISELRALPTWFPEVESKADLAEEVNEPFLKQMLRSQSAEHFATAWCTRLLIIGSVARLLQELDLGIAPEVEGGVLGKLREIVRPLDARVPTGCQSVVSSPHSQEQSWQDWALPPALTILRGAYATSRWLPDVTSACTISILGRAEPGIDAAAVALMQARAYSDPVPSARLGWQPPHGCEVLAYEVPA